MMSRFQAARPNTCFLFVSHSNFVGGLANAIEEIPTKLDPNELLSLDDARRKEIEESLSAHKFKCPKFCAINGFSYDKDKKTIKAEMLRYHEHV